MSFTYGETEEKRRGRYLDRVLTGRVEQKEMRLFALHGPLTARWKGYAGRSQEGFRSTGCALPRLLGSPGHLPG